MCWRDFLGRIGALTILALAIAAFGFGLAAPLLSAFTGTGDGRREEALNLLTRYETMIARRDFLGSQLKTLGNAADDQAGLVVGATSAVAAAALQGELRAIIESVGGEVRSAQVLSPEKIEDFEKIAIQYELSLPPASLQRLLHRLETHRTVLVVDALRLRVPETARVADQSAPETRITGQWVVAGFRRTETDAR